MNASGWGGVFLLTSSVVNGRNLYDPRKQITGATLTSRSITLGRTSTSAFLTEKTTAMIRPGRIVSGLSIVRSSVTPCNGYLFSTVAVHTAALATEGCNARRAELKLPHFLSPGSWNPRRSIGDGSRCFLADDLTRETLSSWLETTILFSLCTRYPEQPRHFR